MIKGVELIKKVREFMDREGLDFFLVPSTDEYLNEYSNINQNSRYYITGFTGSTGDCLVTRDKVYLFVDGRYHIQADDEVNEMVTVIKLVMSQTQKDALVDILKEKAKAGQKFGVISPKTSFFGYKKLSEILSPLNISIVEFKNDPVLEIINYKEACMNKSLRYVSEEYTGSTPEQRLETVVKCLKENDIDVFVVTKLDEIAYLTNLRASYIPYSSTFEAKVVIDKNKCILFTDLSCISEGIVKNFSNKFEIKEKDSFKDYIKHIKLCESPVNIAFSPDSTNLLTYRQLEATKSNLIEFGTSPISHMKSVKTQAELNHLEYCFLKTDIVVNRAVSWLNQKLENGEKISEKAFSDRVKELFTEEGAVGLSFEVIASCATNTAIIHYTNSDPDKYINIGDLILLDTGAYFDGGYATDITRTFIAGGKKANPTDKQKEIFTRVLKAFLNGLFYDLNPDTTGFDIDKKVRDVVLTDLKEGFSYPHGTGHGVGIPVHECPPRLSPAESAKAVLQPGMVFTIEPGLYSCGWGGVRLENTVTVIEENGKKRIVSLARSKFDENLTDYNLLTEEEKDWLKNYNARAIF